VVDSGRRDDVGLRAGGVAMKYLYEEPFSFFSNRKYAEGWARIFGKKKRLPKTAKTKSTEERSDEATTTCDANSPELLRR
jgi:hypothetical protein